jgi:hypothetical protein
MTHIEKLDFVLEILYKQSKILYSQDLYKMTIDDLEKMELTRIVNYLYKHNYVEKTYDIKPNTSKIKPPYFCRITYEGFLFFENGGFNKENKTLKLNHNWKIAKTIANIANAIIIVVIAIIGIYISSESNKKDILLKNNESKIDSLKNELKIISLKKAE